MGLTQAAEKAMGMTEDDEPYDYWSDAEVERREQAGLAPDDEYRLAAERAQAAMIKIRERIEFEFG